MSSCTSVLQDVSAIEKPSQSVNAWTWIVIGINSRYRWRHLENPKADYHFSVAHFSCTNSFSYMAPNVYRRDLYVEDLNSMICGQKSLTVRINVTHRFAIDFMLQPVRKCNIRLLYELTYIIIMDGKRQYLEYLCTD